MASQEMRIQKTLIKAVSVTRVKLMPSNPRL